MILLLSALAALACPTVATGTPSQLSFDTAQVAIVRQGDRTTFSVSINPSGDQQAFALVMPVPEVLAEDQIHVLDPELFARLDGYTAPRRVTDAGCSYYASNGAGGSSDTGFTEDEDGPVDVEAHYIVGEYDIVILSATESGALFEWLDTNAYYLPEGAEPRLQEYIDAGSFFLAAKVAESAVIPDGTPLSPLQLSYTNPVFTIPIRLATLNSPGEQDMVIYAITDMEERGMNGRVGISNYSEFSPRTACLWGESTEDFRAFYEEHFTAAWSELGDAGWTVEYAGQNGDCNPCTGIYLTEEDAISLGFESPMGLSGHHMTRIRMRYTPEQADEDIMLYGSGIYSPKSNSFADDNESNRQCIEFYCDGSPNADYSSDDGAGGDGGAGGSGDGGEPEAGDGGGSSDGPQDVTWHEADEPAKASGCSTAPVGAGAGLLLALAGLVRRRKR